MPTFRSLQKIVIPSRKNRFLEFLEQFLTPTPSRELAKNPFTQFFNPAIRRRGVMGFANEFLNPRVRRHGFWKTFSQFFSPEPPRSGFMKVVTAFLDAPVYRLQQGGRDIVRPREKEATFLQRLMSGINEFFNAYTHFGDLFRRPAIILEVPTDEFKQALEKLIFGSRLRIERMTEQLFNGQLTPQQFHAQMILEVKRLNVAAALIGARGLGNVTPGALTGVVQQTASELLRLQKFLQNTFGNNLNIPFGPDAGLTTGQFRAYALKFANAGRATSNIAQNELVQSLYGAGIDIGGRLYGRRVSPNDDRTCDDCAAWHEMGWIEGGPPAPTQDCICQQNCRCYVEYAMVSSPSDLPDDIAY